ncbi:hypothetical protein ANCDUO_13381 [Ancylostoma duodenale]|uniref:Uncharacterized protein n=1 Tax=Ancylostoma duodenale TaxID=51022 RepID=A0A0C2D332_9BILA|nr:hypothetical protein ANCDUO_13381 [Ancylostoma duodenale]
MMGQMETSAFHHLLNPSFNVYASEDKSGLSYALIAFLATPKEILNNNLEERTNLEEKSNLEEKISLEEKINLEEETDLEEEINVEEETNLEENIQAHLVRPATCKTL